MDALTAAIAFIGLFFFGILLAHYGTRDGEDLILGVLWFICVMASAWPLNDLLMAYGYTPDSPMRDIAGFIFFGMLMFQGILMMVILKTNEIRRYQMRSLRRRHYM